MTIAQVQQDLLEGSEKFRELVTSIDAVRGSISIQEAAVSSQPITYQIKFILCCRASWAEFRSSELSLTGPRNTPRQNISNALIDPAYSISFPCRTLVTSLTVMQKLF